MLEKPLLHSDALWKQRFRAPAILNTQLAWDNPTRGLVVTNTSDTYQLYAWDVPTGALRQLTDKPAGKMFGWLSPDGRYVYYHDDQGGDELGHYVRVLFEGGAPFMSPPATGAEVAPGNRGTGYDGGDKGAPEDITPELPAYASWSLAISRAGNRIGFAMTDAEGFHLYGLDVGAHGALGQPHELYHSKTLAYGPLLSQDGTIAVIRSTERTGKPQYSLVAIDMTSGERIAELWDGPDTSLEAMVMSPQPGDSRLVAATNRTGIETLLLWDPRTGERADLAFEGLAGACRAFDWSPDGTLLVFRTFHQAVQQLYLYHFPSGRVMRVPQTGVHGGPYFATDQEIWSHWQDPSLPPRLVAIDAETGARTRTVLAAGEVPAGRPWKSINFRSSDGQAIQGWLGLPEGTGPFPVILETHGGPESATSPTFSPGSQAWLDHGFAYLTINYRGSTTFGREFQKKIWGDLGHWEVEDIVAARAWLVKEGIARAEQVFLTGWSYGGYLTLQALGKYPELWAGGMAGVAVADWVALYEDETDALRAYDVAFFGGTPQEKPAQYAASSPITYAEHVRAPVLIIQGHNDTRCPARQIELYEQRMKELDKAIEVHWFDAGHLAPAAHIEQAVDHFERMLRFVYGVMEE